MWFACHQEEIISNHYLFFFPLLLRVAKSPVPEKAAPSPFLVFFHWLDFPSFPSGVPPHLPPWCFWDLEINSFSSQTLLFLHFGVQLNLQIAINMELCRFSCFVFFCFSTSVLHVNSCTKREKKAASCVNGVKTKVARRYKMVAFSAKCSLRTLNNKNTEKEAAC